MLGYRVLAAGLFQWSSRSSLFGFCAAVMNFTSGTTDGTLAVRQGMFSVSSLSISPTELYDLPT